MPWWIWLLLALFMLVMIIAGVAYAILHAVRGMKSIAPLGARISELVNAMQDASVDEKSVEPPVFTKPLVETSDRYAQAHARVIERQAAKRERHIQQWIEWNDK